MNVPITVSKTESFCDRNTLKTRLVLTGKKELKCTNIVHLTFSVLWKEEPMDTDQSSNMLSSIQSEVAKYQMLIEEENQKLKRYKVCSLCFSD